MGFLVGIDVGATFTDLVRVRPDGDVARTGAAAARADAAAGIPARLQSPDTLDMAVDEQVTIELCRHVRAAAAE